MAMTRVHELAKEFGTESKRILDELAAMGSSVRSASATVDPKTERALRERLRGRLNAANSGTVPLPRSGRVAAPIESPPVDEVGPTNGKDTAHRSTGSADETPDTAAREWMTKAVSTVPTKAPQRVVSLPSLAREADLRIVLRECKRAAEEGAAGRVALDFKEARGFYPSIAVPAVAIIQHFRDQGVPIEMLNLPRIAETMRIRNPLEASASNLSDLNEPLSRLWAYFNHKQANALTSAFMDCMRRKVECKAGVLEALEWCLYEVLDNVMQHSNSEVGYAMLQLHVQSKRLAVCVSDTGIGVQRSLASSPAYRPRTAFDALTMAVEEGVTRNKQTNQGNGLFGLVKIVEQNGGKLHLRSGRGQMLLQGDRVSGANDQSFIGPDNHGTTVDFQLKVDKPVSIGNALNYEPANLFLETLESTEGEHVIDIRNQAGGAGSRLAARELKTLIVNVLNDGVPHVVLDFEGQAVVSSSFADEVIGKLFAEMGFNTFNLRIKLRHMNETVSTLVDRAIARRLAQQAE